MLEYLLLCLCIGLESFFSGSETGLYCVNRMRLRFRLERRWPGAAALQKLTSDPQLAISTMLIGTNLSVYLASVLCSRRLGAFEALAPRADLYTSLILPPVLLVFAEIVPKSIFQRGADTLMYKAALPLSAARTAFYPVLFVMKGLGALIRRLALRLGAEEAGELTVEKFRFFLSEGAALGVVTPHQQAMAENIFHLRSLGVARAMVPLENVVMVPETVGPDGLLNVLRDHRFSRLPVYSGERADIAGIVNIIDVLAGRGAALVPSDIMRPPLFLGARLSVMDALYALQKAHRQMAVVTDGEAAVGIVTVKDLVERIVGELAEW